MTVTITAPRASTHAPQRTAPAVQPAPGRRPRAERTAPDIVDVWGLDSFPASDAPANW